MGASDVGRGHNSTVFMSMNCEYNKTYENVIAFYEIYLVWTLVGK